MPKKKEFEPFKHYNRLNPKLKKFCRKSYTEAQLKNSYHYARTTMQEGKIVYVRQSRTGFRKEGKEGMDLFFEEGDNGRWRVTEECREVIYSDQNNIDRAKFLEGILSTVDAGTILTENSVSNLERLLKLLNHDY
ncbi:MAG: hypothetical protein CMH63_02295 [Nanoarchaeota archaeon]|jgi:hypothetical protein|nr:hypothetical protein [Nanoarchaeota archaeon]|tara:strand:- start:13044 stop:13448 length:405 start_codon:yes stop_codon:yes gene_type:complete